MTTLVFILNHNLRNITEQLYDSLKPHEKNVYSLHIIDNGSDEAQVPRRPNTHKLSKNTFFGGGLNWALKYWRDHNEYDSMLFLNNDLIVHGQNFVESLRNELITNNYTIVSPCVMEAERSRANYWNVMRNWGSKSTRLVKWVDFQAPMFHRRILEEAISFSDILIYGWGQDVYSGIICENMGWKVGVCDFVPVVHMKEMTFHSKVCKKDGKPFSYNDYRNGAISNMNKFFSEKGLKNKLEEYKAYSRHYSYHCD